MSTDSEFLAKSRTSPGAFTELFEPHSAPVHAFVGRRVGAEAADREETRHEGGIEGAITHLDAAAEVRELAPR